jgi:hypothetical protein
VGALTAGRDFQSRRRARRAHHRTGRVDDRTPSTWEWSFETDGALALDRADDWEVRPRRTRVDPPETDEAPDVLQERVSFATVPPMRSRRVRRQTVRMRQRRARQHRIRRIVGLLALAVVLLVTLVLTAFGTGQSRAPRVTTAPAHRLLPAGPPRPQVVAMQGSLPLQLPVPQERLSAIGYHAPGDGALPLEPLGRQANEGFLSRLFHRVFGGDGGKLRYYQLDGGVGAATGSLDVGAPARTDVYSPVDGTVVGLSDYILDGERYGARIDIQPAAAPSLIVSVTRLRPDPSLTVGSTVTASTAKLGTLLDLSRVEQQALARYTKDAGNHVSIEVRPAATLALP